MRFKLFKLVFSVEKATPPKPPRSVEERFIDEAEALTDTWKELRTMGSKFRPWIDWATKEVVITEPVYDQRKLKAPSHD